MPIRKYLLFAYKRHDQVSWLADVQEPYQLLQGERPSLNVLVLFVFVWNHLWRLGGSDAKLVHCTAVNFHFLQSYKEV